MKTCESCGEKLSVVQFVNVVVLESREVLSFDDKGYPVYGEVQTEDSEGDYFGAPIYQCQACGYEITKEEAMEALR